MTRTKTIQVPIKYEEIYVNGKRLGKKNNLDSLFSALNPNRNVKSKQKEDKSTRLTRNDARPKTQLDGNSVLSKILPLYGEQVRISKKMIKYADAVISKSKVLENKRIKVELAGEKVLIRYPDGTERTLESTAPEPTVRSVADAA